MELLNVGPLLRQYIIVILVNLNVLSVGLGLAWPSPVLVKLRNETDNPLNSPITENEGSWIVSIGFLVGVPGAFLAGFLANVIGRKYTICLASIPRILGFVLMIFANEVWMLYIGRVCMGLSDSFVFSVVPMYSSEIASKEIRGGLGTLLQIFSSLGIVTMLSMGPFLNYKILNIICTCIVVCATVPLIFLPDSPLFLHFKGKKKEALTLLNKLRKTKCEVNEELKEYDNCMQEEKMRIADILKSKAVLKALAIVIIMGIGGQATGFNAVSFYLQTILESTHTSVSPEAASVVIGTIQLLASLCTTVMTDRFGRKPIMCSSLVGVTIGLMGLGVFFKLKELDYPITGVLQYLPLVSLILVIYCYSAGFGSLIWLLLSELFDGSARAFGMSVGLVSSVLCVFLSTRFFAPLTSAIGPPGTYWLFSVNTLIFSLFIMFCVPETKGRTFAEIQATLSNGSRRKNAET